MTTPKRVLELNQSIEATQNADGSWTARLPLLGVKEVGDSHDAAQDAAIAAMFSALGEMSREDSRNWIEANSSPAEPGDLPDCVEPIGLT